MITLGEIQASTVWFRSPINKDHFYVCVGSDERWKEVRRHHHYDRCKRATGVNLEENYSSFFMVWVDDSMEPPVAIVRADHVQDAIDTFIEELPWAHLDQEEVDEAMRDHAEKGKEVDIDNPPDWIGWGPHGEPYNSESLMVREIKLALVEVDL